MQGPAIACLHTADSFDLFVEYLVPATLLGIGTGRVLVE
jgi:hypothetical protein